MTGSELTLRRVTVRLGGTPVVNDISLAVRAGEVTALVGPNGAGKSTALRAAAGLLKTDGGTVELDGIPLSQWRPRDIARRIAVVPQSPAYPPLFTVRAVVALGRTPHLSFLGNEGARDWEATDRAMARAGVSAFADRRLDQMSGGERQRVVLARALAQEPSVLLLDEPTASLDLQYQRAILALVARLARDQRLACLVVLHELSLASQFCDRIGLLSAGQLVALGTPSQVLRSDLLGEVYRTPVRVLAHPDSGVPVVVHADRALDSSDSDQATIFLEVK